MGTAAATERDAPATIASSVGQDLRALRKSKGLTLTELAAATGRSVGFLSQVERGLSEISITDLRKIAKLFAVPLSWFFVNADVPEDERGYVVRAHARRRVGSSEDGLLEELLSPDLGGSFEMVRSVFEPGSALPGAGFRDTEEAGYVVSGELELWIGGRRFHLRAGDSFRFDRESHRWRNPGPEPAVVIWVISPAVY
jgi:transcriptional regulator with XRE-family HTH domain